LLPPTDTKQGSEWYSKTWLPDKAQQLQRQAASGDVYSFGVELSLFKRGGALHSPRHRTIYNPSSDGTCGWHALWFCCFVLQSISNHSSSNSSSTNIGTGTSSSSSSSSSRNSNLRSRILAAKSTRHLASLLRSESLSKTDHECMISTVAAGQR
jgi:hypothetical protein